MPTTTTSSSGANNGTTPNNNDSINNSYLVTSTSDKTVTLYDWWLIKSEKDYNGRRLAVGGLKSKGTLAAQIFSSAPIVKRYNLITLETADGLTVFIKGNINRTRTKENGFSFKVCECFQIGFPCIWEDFSYHCQEDSISSNTSRKLSDFGSLKDCETNGKSSEDKLEDVVVDFTSQMTAEVMGPYDSEKRKTDGSLEEYNVRSEVVLNALEHHHRDCSSKMSNSNTTLEDHYVPTGSDEKNSSTPFKLDRDNLDDSKFIFSFKRKYLSDRIKALCSSKSTNTNLFDSVLDDDVNDMEAPVHSKSNIAKSSSLPNVDLLDVTRKFVVATLPNDSANVLVNHSSGNNYTTQLDMSKHNLMELGSNVICCTSSDVNILSPVKTPKEFTGRSSPNAFVTSCGNTESTKCTTGSSEARRSSKLINVKKGTDNSQEIIINNLTCDNERTRHDASRDSLIELGSGVSDCNPSEFNMVSSVEAPSISLKSFSRKDTTEKLGGDCSARYNSPKECSTSRANNYSKKESMGPFEARSSSKLMTMKKGDDNQQRTIRKTTEVRRSTRPINMTKWSYNRQEAVGKKSVLEHPNSGPHSKTRKRLEYMTDTKATPMAKNKKNESSVLSPEKSNYKRTKSGRLRVPPLSFWNNQRVIYDRNLQIAGILNGLPAESPTVTGSDSNPVRKKPKRI